MNLPLAVDIAIGLVFIYLILSLLTSEIQELIATLLQWRAEHLKKSIENLLTGENVNDPVYQAFVDDLYSSPLIKSLNQEAKGLFAVFFRRIVRVISALYHTLTGTRNIFGSQKSGPSYIPPETFSVALLQRINIGDLSQKISELTAHKFRDDSLAALQEILDDLRVSLGDDPFVIGNGSLLEREFKTLKQTLDETVANFISGRSTLAESLEQLTNQLHLFIDNTNSLLEGDHPCKEVIRKRLHYLKQAIAQRRLEPTVTEVLRLVFTDDQAKLRRSPLLAEIVDKLNQENPELLQNVADLPQNLKQNLLSLANQARLKAKSLEEEVRQLEQEVAIWFSNSMDRAAGVYRRNAKGIAILIGFLVAILINADTFHIVHRLSRDTVLRSTITQAADQAVLTRDSSPPIVPPPDATVAPDTVPGEPPPVVVSSTREELQEVKEAVDGMLDELPLPIGWNSANVAVQEETSRGWPIPILRRLLGWFVTGIALSMGATFWFDLLNKVVKTRSTGAKPDKPD